MISWRVTFAMTVVMAVTACSAPPRSAAVPRNVLALDAVEGYHDIRFYADASPPFLAEHLNKLRLAVKINPALAEQQDVLALSGGAEDGAYGAGFLKGWTERQNRPEFTWVTGISIGALIAPFAFLGSDYDGVIERVFTQVSADDIVVFQPMSLLFGGSALGDTTPLRSLLERELTEEVVSAIARESRRGRYLMIGTTNLDAQRHVIWNIGRIAESGRKGSRDLIRSIMLASAAVPGLFPPTQIDVVIDGKRLQELHVDGGITHQVFAYPPSINTVEIEAMLGVSPKKTMWVIRNAKINADYDITELGVADIVARSINTLTKYQGRGDIAALQQLASRDGFEFRLTFVPANFEEEYTSLFDPKYMRALFKVGYKTALGGDPWQDVLLEEPKLVAP